VLGFEGGLAWGCMGEMHQAYIGVWEESGRVMIELEIKSEFN
jgi:hypothetical protein